MQGKHEAKDAGPVRSTGTAITVFPPVPLPSSMARQNWRRAGELLCLY